MFHRARGLPPSHMAPPDLSCILLLVLESLPALFQAKSRTLLCHLPPVYGLGPSRASLTKLTPVTATLSWGPWRQASAVTQAFLVFASGRPTRCGEECGPGANLPGFPSCPCHSLAVWQGTQPLCDSVTYL